MTVIKLHTYFAYDEENRKDYYSPIVSPHNPTTPDLKANIKSSPGEGKQYVR